MSKERDSKKRFAFATRLFAEGAASDELPSEIQIIPTGKWNHPVYGEMEITPADITEMKRNFDDGVRLDLPITAGHDNGMSGGELPAVAWYGEVIDKGYGGLWTKPEWLAEGESLIKSRSFKYFSTEFYADYEDPETGERRKNVLVGGALTNRPYFKGMTPVGAFSEVGIMSKSFNDDMNLKDILTKKPNELSETEKAFVREHEAELNDEQKTAYASVFDEGAGSGADGEDEPNDETENEPEQNPKVEASEVKITAAEYALLKEKADKGQQAFTEVETMKLGSEVAKMVFSSSNTIGHFLPKQKDAVVAFMFSLNAKQRDQFRNIVNNIPKLDSKLFGEIGDGGHEGTTSKAEEVNAAIDAKIKASEGKLSFSAAFDQLKKENPQLIQEYNDEMQEQRG